MGGNPRLKWTAPDPDHMQWNPVQHMVCDTWGDGTPITGEWIVMEVPVVDYGLSVYATPVTSKNKDDILDNGVFTYNPEEKTLFIWDSFGLSGSGSIVQNEEVDGLTVEFDKEMIYLSAFNGFYSKKDMTIQGNGRLVVDTEITTTDMYKGSTLTIRDVTIEAESENWGIAGENNETLVLENAIIRSKAPQGAICDFDKGITLSGCRIGLPSGGYVKNGDIVDADGNLATEVFITMLYDLNNDGKISAADIQVIINEMKKSQAEQDMKYDLNGDDKISAADIQVIINEMKK